MSDRHVSIAAADPAALVGAELECDEANDDAVRRRLVVGLAVLAGFALGLALAMVLIPDLPHRVLIPVERPTPSFHIDPNEGIGA